MTPMDPRRRHCLEAMGIPLWLPRGAPQAVVPEPVAEEPEEVIVAEPEPVKVAPVAAPSGPRWEELAAQVAGCRKCAELVANRTQTVFGAGSREAEWMIIGEAPGADEDRLGEPFVGRAGKLLDAMLAAIDLDRRRNAYIANVLKCRPPNNRDPKPEESAACFGYLQRQVELLQPKIILAIGRISAQTLLRTATPVGRLRGRAHTFPGTDIPLVVTYHPAYLLRSPGEKRKAWQDLRLACDVYDQRR